MAAGVRDIRVRFTGDASGLRRAAQDAQDATEETGRSANKLGGKLTAFAAGAVGGFAVAGVAAFKNFAGGAVDAFSAVEDATAAAEVQFGGAADSVVAFAEQASKSFGLSKQAALDAQNEFGTFGKAAGLQEAELAKFSQNLTGLAGDLASFKGTSTEQAINAIGGALRGESEGMRAYGVLLSADAVAAEALSSGLAKTTKDLGAIKAAQFGAEEAQRKYSKAVKENGEDSVEAQKAAINLAAAEKRLKKETEGANPKLTDQQKLMATQQLIFKATGDAQGDYARTSSSTANVQKTLEAETLNAQAALGAKLAPAITFVRGLKLKLIQTATGLIGKIDSLIGFVKSNQTTFLAIAGVIGAIVIPALVRMGVQATIAGAKMVASAVRQAAAWVMLGVQSNLAALRVAAAWLISMGPIALVIAAVVGLVVLIVKNWDRIKTATAAAFGWVWNKVKQVFGWLKGLFLNFTGPGLLIKHFDTIVDFIKKLPGRIASAASGMFDGIKDAFRGALNWLIDKWNALEFKASIPEKAFGIPIPGGGSSIGFGTPDIPRLAKGGTANAGVMHLVGERGPELFVPGRTGTVVPNHDLGGGGDVYLHADLGEGITQVVKVKLERDKRSTRNAVLAGSRRAHG